MKWIFESNIHKLSVKTVREELWKLQKLDTSRNLSRNNVGISVGGEKYLDFTDEVQQW
jgi:hypothetical protein